MLGSYSLILNSNNAVKMGQYYNRLVFKFINGSFTIKDNMKIQLTKASIPNSFFNISSFYGNNTFSINMPRGSTMVTYNAIIPDGNYTISQLNAFFEFFFDTNNLYLINSSGVKQYYASLQLNTIYYSIQLNLTKIPTTLPINWTAPSGWVFPTVSQTPQLNINSKIGNLIGFSQGLYPSTVPQTTDYMKLSNIIPKSASVNNIIFSCSLVNNPVSFPSNVLDSFGLENTEFGANIYYEAKTNRYIPVKPGTYNELVLDLMNEDFLPLTQLDPNMLITLTLMLE